MTQEERDILLKDLSARLPYGVKCKHDKAGVGTLINVLSNGHITIDLSYFGYNLYSIADIETVKPYLFPLSSMTEEQKTEFNKLTPNVEIDSSGISSAEDYIPDDRNRVRYVELKDMILVIDWLNANHFDYRGLINKGLAIDATDLNIY